MGGARVGWAAKVIGGLAGKPPPACARCEDIFARRARRERIAQANKSKAKLYYGDACNLPDALGSFDIAVMVAVLLHTRSPLTIIEQCAKRAKMLVISDCLFPDIEGSPVCRLHPTRENKSWDTWWHFSTDFLAQFIGVLGYDNCTITRHTQMHHHGPVQFFTIVASGAISAE